jgi:cystathionine beta-lyase/cystathionine gamma-synthase
VHWAYTAPFREAYQRLERTPWRPGGLMTLDLKRPLAEVYDRLALPKGPSFGTAFTLVCPYIHLAHYDLLQSEAGRRQLQHAGIHGNMLRISVGAEPLDSLIEVFDRCL